MTNTHYQCNWIWNHLGNKALSASKRFSSAGSPTSAGSASLDVSDAFIRLGDWTKRRKQETHQHPSSLLPDRGGMWPASSGSCHHVFPSNWTKEPFHYLSKAFSCGTKESNQYKYFQIPSILGSFEVPKHSIVNTENQPQVAAASARVLCLSHSWIDCLSWVMDKPTSPLQRITCLECKVSETSTS